MNKKQILSVAFSVFVSVFFVYAVVYAASTIGNAVSVGSTLTVTGATTLNGAVTMGDDINDILTPTGYFTYVRVGTSTTFGHIAAVSADELGVEGNVELDGSVWMDGAVTLGDDINDTLTATGYFTYLRVGTSTTFGHIADVGADELGVEGAAEIDGAVYLDGAVNLGESSADLISVPGTLNTALIWAATTTTYGLDMNAATMTTDLRLNNGATIANGDADTLTITEATVAISGNETVSGTLTLTGATILNGDVTLGNDINDVLTPTGYFTYLRVGTSTTFGNIGAVGADELGVEGDVEIDGTAYLDGSVTLGNDINDVLTPTGYFTYLRVGTSTTFGHIADVGADELGVEGAVEVDGAAYFDGSVTLGDGTGSDTLSVPATVNTALIWAATTTTYGLDMDAATFTSDIRLQNGEIIDNATDGKILITSDAGTVTGEIHGISLTHTGTLSSGDSMVGINSAVTTAGTAGTWVSGIYAKVTQGETKNVNGYISGAEFEVVNSNTNVSDWFPLVLNANSTTNGQHSSYIALRSYGTTALNSFLWIEDQTIGTDSSTSLVSTSGSDLVTTHTLRIYIDDSPYWILLNNAH